MNKNIILMILVLGLGLMVIPSFVSAGLGIGYSSQSFMAEEGKTFCLDYYKVYNPWDDDSYVTVDVSPELKEIVIKQETESLLVPAQTSSKEAISLNQFCFKVPEVYEREYLISGMAIAPDKLSCDGQEQKVYEGEIVVTKAPAPIDASVGAGGSATQSSISAPLKIRVPCNAYSWDYTSLYVALAALSGIVIFIVLFRRYRTPKLERDRARLAKLKAEISRAEKKK